MAKSGFAKEHLKAFIDRIERLESEKAAIAADVKEVYAELKGVGFDAKIVRKVIALRKLDTADFQNQMAVLDMYLGAVGMGGTPLGDYASRPRPAPDDGDGGTRFSARDTETVDIEEVIAAQDDGGTVLIDSETGEVLEESQVKADVEAHAVGADRAKEKSEAPNGVESVSRGASARSLAATSEIMDVTSRERPAPMEIPDFLRRPAPPKRTPAIAAE